MVFAQSATPSTQHLVQGGGHGNTRDLVHVQFIKEGLYWILFIYFCFSEFTGCAEVALRAHAWARAHTPYAHFPPTHLHDRAVTGAL